MCKLDDTRSRVVCKDLDTVSGLLCISLNMTVWLYNFVTVFTGWVLGKPSLWWEILTVRWEDYTGRGISVYIYLFISVTRDLTQTLICGISPNMCETSVPGHKPGKFRKGQEDLCHQHHWSRPAFIYVSSNQKIAPLWTRCISLRIKVANESEQKEFAHLYSMSQEKLQLIEASAG